MLRWLLLPCPRIYTGYGGDHREAYSLSYFGRSNLRSGLQLPAQEYSGYLVSPYMGAGKQYIK